MQAVAFITQSGVRSFIQNSTFSIRAPPVVAYIVTSNFTRSDLRENVEANVRLAVPRNAPAAVEAQTIFDSMFQGEFATPLTPELESGYRELQAALQEARLHGAGSEEALRFRFSGALLWRDIALASQSDDGCLSRVRLTSRRACEQAYGAGNKKPRSTDMRPVMFSSSM